MTYPYAQTPAPAPEPRKRPWPARHWVLTTLGVLAALGIILAATSSGGGSGGGSGPAGTGSTGASTVNRDARDDVKLTGCEVGAASFGVATLKVTNSTPKAANYVITVAFNDAAGNQEGTGTAVVETLQPGQSSTTKAQGLDELSAGGKCVITKVERFNS